MKVLGRVQALMSEVPLYLISPSWQLERELALTPPPPENTLGPQA